MGLLVFTSILLVFGALAFLALRSDRPVLAVDGQPAEIALEPLLAGWSAALAFDQAAQRNLLVLRLTALAAFLASAAAVIAGWEVSSLDIDHLEWFLFLPFGLWIAAGTLDLLHYLPAALAARRALSYYGAALKPWGGALPAAAAQIASGVSPRRAGAAALLYYALPAAVLSLLIFWFLPHSIGDEDQSEFQPAAVSTYDESRT